MIKKVSYISVISIVSFFLSCSKEEVPPPDKIIGDWVAYSITDNDGGVIVLNELRAQLVELVEGYSCLNFTATVNEKLVSTSFINIDENSNSCKTPSLTIYTWSIEEATGFYKFSQGTNIVTYLITFSNNDSRMTWVDQKSNAISIWDRVETPTETTTP